MASAERGSGGGGDDAPASTAPAAPVVEGKPSSGQTSWDGNGNGGSESGGSKDASKDLFKAVDILKMNGGAGLKAFCEEGEVGEEGGGEQGPGGRGRGAKTNAVHPEEGGASKKVLPSKQASVTSMSIKSRFGESTLKAMQFRSLFLFSPKNKLRRWCVRRIIHPQFDNGVTVLIMFNCLCLALDSPDLDDSHWKRRVSQTGEYLIAVVFVFELILKSTAMGLVMHVGSYLRDMWNLLDFVVVVLGLISLLPNTSNLTALRTFRLVKPLRTISSSSSMRMLAGALLNSIPMLGDVLLLWGFVFIIFGLLGMQLWMGSFHYHCVREDGTVPPGFLETTCGSSSYQCPGNLRCTKYDEVNGGYLPNPNNNLSSFDHFGVTFIAIFQTQTREGWSTLAEYTENSWSPWGFAYWVMLVLFGSFFVVNLATAVVFASFSRMAAEALAADAIARIRKGKPSSRPLQIRDASTPENGIRSRFHALCDNSWFQGGVLLAIGFNTILLAIEHHNMPQDMVDFLKMCNLVFVAIFAVEMVIKLVGLGPLEYVRDKFNIFDGIIVIVSIVELSIPSGGPKGVSVLRTFRLLRVIKLLKSWVSLRKLIEVVVKSLSSIANFLVILAIMLFTYALLGMSLFAGRFCEEYSCTDPSIDSEAACVGEWVPPGGEADLRAWECTVPFRLHYDNLYYALLTSFLLFTSENWYIVMFEGMRARSWESSFYFISILLIGHYMLLNLFLAGVVRNVVDSEEDEQPSKSRISLESMSMMLRSRSMDKPKEARSSRTSRIAGFLLRCCGQSDESESENWDPATPGAPPPPEDKKKKKAWRHDWSLWLLSPENSLRAFCSRTVHHRHFDNFFLPLIILSSISLAVESPHKTTRTTVTEVIDTMDLIFNTLFTIEAGLKIIALGFWTPKKVGGDDDDVELDAQGNAIEIEAAYLRDNWNRLDFLIVLVSWSSALFDNPSLKSLKALRTLRALRPLRLLNRNEGMKRVVVSLLQVIPEIGNIIVLLTLCWFIFAILGVQLFSGKFYECDDASREWEAGYGEIGDGSDECLGQWSPYGNGTMVDREWSSLKPNFDNVGSAMLVLFELCTMEDWNDHMMKGIDARDVRRAPKVEASPANALYYVAFILVGALFVSNLLVSAVVSYYIKADSGSQLLSEGQQAWVQAMRQSLREKPEKQPVPPARHSRRHAIFVLIMRPAFDYFIMSVILLSVLVMMCAHFDSSKGFDVTCEWITNVFNLIFVTEAVLKIAGLGLWQYMEDWWNRFDFTIVALSVLTFIADTVLGGLGFNPSAIRIFRVFRTARVLRMVRGLKGLRTLLRTFILSIPSLWNVGSLLFLVFFVYAILGMYLLGDASRNGIIDDKTNFENFPRSLKLLFRTCTGESWNAVLHELIEQDYMVSIPFFVTFLLIAYFVMLNLFVAVILENFTEANSVEDSKLTSRDFAAFAILWSEFDPMATMTMPATKLAPFLQQLEVPLGLKGRGHMTKTEKLRFVAELELENRGVDGVVHYHEVLKSLMYIVVGTELPEEIAVSMDKVTNRAFPSLRNLPPGTASIAEVWAAVRLQAVVRGMLNRKKSGRKKKVRSAMAATNRLSMMGRAGGGAGAAGKGAAGAAAAAVAAAKDGEELPAGGGGGGGGGGAGGALLPAWADASGGGGGAQQNLPPSPPASSAMVESRVSPKAVPLVPPDIKVEPHMLRTVAGGGGSGGGGRTEFQRSEGSPGELHVESFDCESPYGSPFQAARDFGGGWSDGRELRAQRPPEGGGAPPP